MAVIEQRPRKSKLTRRILLPPEHGSWGFTLEPILLGLFIAPTATGFALAVGMFFAFLLRWPLKLAITQRKRRRERAQVAARVALFYGICAAIGLTTAVALGGWQPVLPLLLALPFAVAFLYFDFRNQSRSWQAELAGPATFAFTASGIALAGGMGWLPSLTLWLLLMARAWPSVLYVRARILLEKGKEWRLPDPLNSLNPVRMAHIAAFVIANILQLHPAIPIAFLLLWLRAEWGLSSRRLTHDIRVIGISEMVLGILTVVVIATTYPLQ